MGQSAVVDASLILSLGEASALHLLWDDPACAWHIAPIVRGEVTSEPTKSEISRALLNGDLTATELDTDSEVELRAFAHWSGQLGAGEAEAIAIGVSRGWVVGMEDLSAQRRLTRDRGATSWVNASALLVKAVTEGRLSLPAADSIFVRLDCYSGYRNRGVTSLADLLS